MKHGDLFRLVLGGGPGYPAFAGVARAGAVVAFAVLLALACGLAFSAELQIRAGATVLELAGFWVTWRERTTAGQQAGRTLLTSLQTEWRRARGAVGLLPPQIVTVTGSGSIGFEGRACGVTVAQTGASTEERLAVLERGHEALQRQARDIDRELTAEKQAREAADTLQRSERISADRELRQEVENLRLGDIHFEQLGPILFAVGLLLSTWSPEIAGLIS